MKVKAIGLFSGGLDSVIAVQVLQDQGIDVLGVTFETPFFGSAKARKAAEAIDLPLRVITITEEYLVMLKAPRYGYGKNMNPCIDCHALMLKRAGGLMADEGADFLFTGEVLGQRPKSQTGQALGIVAKLSGFDGLILRPLSARLLPPTIPEAQGKVDRERLLDIQGRGRKPQMALAEHYGIESYSSPGGGCLLTDAAFSHRLRDLFSAEDNPAIAHIELLKVGRHLRTPDGAKIVVGRNRSENETIERLSLPGDSLISIPGIPGPLVAIPGGGDEAACAIATAVCAYYGSGPKDRTVEAAVRRFGRSGAVATKAADGDAIRAMMIETPSPAKRRR